MSYGKKHIDIKTVKFTPREVADLKKERAEKITKPVINKENDSNT